jgi:outer membrane protein TolC
MMRASLTTLVLALASSVAPEMVVAQAPVSSAPVVTLGEARRRAGVVDPDAVAARAQVATADWERRAARMDLFTPNVSFGTSYTRSTTPLFSAVGDDGEILLPHTATSATLQGSYTLLGVGKLSSLKRARASLESAEASETAARFRTALATDMAYFSVLADRELLSVVTERLSRAREQFAIARVRVSAGDVLATDSLQLLLEVNRAQLAVLRRDSALAVSRLRLGRQIGLPGPVDAAPIDTALPPPLPLSEEDAVREMRERGPDIEAARAAERRASAIVGTEREGYFPDIVLGASTAAFDSVLFPSAQRSSQFAVTVSLPIWDGGRRELSIARARSQRDVVRAERADIERAAAELMAESYHGYRTARAGIELALVGVQVAAETYRVQGVRYREGATTILDLLEAQIALSEAEATLVQSRYSAHLALAQIEALLGRRLLDATPTNR